MRKVGRFKKMYNTGGEIPAENGLNSGLSAGLSTGLSAINPLVDAFGKENAYGRQSGLATGLKRGASLAQVGLKIGGPWGAAIGGAVGLGSGLIQSVSAKRKEETQETILKQGAVRDGLLAGEAKIAADPSLIYGNKSATMYKNGGNLKQSSLMDGYNQSGKFKQLSNKSIEVQGPKHENGGVQIPGAEVEGGETISNGFVFSEELGFAKLHKPIARAIGKLEDKPITPVRKKTMEVLKNKEQELALSQEFFKHKNGIN